MSSSLSIPLGRGSKARRLHNFMLSEFRTDKDLIGCGPYMYYSGGKDMAYGKRNNIGITRSYDEFSCEYARHVVRWMCSVLGRSRYYYDGYEEIPIKKSDPRFIARIPTKYKSVIVHEVERLNTLWNSRRVNERKRLV